MLPKKIVETSAKPNSLLVWKNRLIFLNVALLSLGICTTYFFSLQDWLNFPKHAESNFLSSFNILFYKVLVFIFLIDLLFLGFHHSALKRILFPSRSGRADILFFILTLSGVMELTIILMSFGVGYYIPELVKSYIDLKWILYIPNPLAQFLVYLVIYDFLTYWRHRFAHTLPWWWEAHKFHHSATEMNLITSYRVHPLDWTFHLLFVCFPLAILGTPVNTYIIIKLATRILSAIRHSMVNWDWGFIGQYILISPIAHRIHHSPLEEHWDKNFGHICPIWDRMFGSWYKGKVVNQEISVTDNYFIETPLLPALMESTRCCFSLLFQNITLRKK